MDGSKMSYIAAAALSQMSAPAPAPATSGSLPTSINVASFLMAVDNYPTPPEYRLLEQLQDVYPVLAQNSWLCGKQATLTFHESYFMYLLAIDPDMNPSMAYFPTRFVLLQIAINAVENNGNISDTEISFLAAIQEHALSTDMSMHDKQRAFFELWWSTPEFTVPTLAKHQMTRLTAIHKEIVGYIDRQGSNKDFDKTKLRHLEIVARLLKPQLLIPNSSSTTNPAFKLSFGRGSQQRNQIEKQVFNNIAASLKDLRYVDRVGEMFDKLGVSDVLCDGGL